MCLICRASVIAKVEFFQHLYALTVSGLSPASWRTQSGKVQLGERWTSLCSCSKRRADLQGQGGGEEHQQPAA